jgi:DNA-binding beta-propeller fold protein YncE
MINLSKLLSLILLSLSLWACSGGVSGTGDGGGNPVSSDEVPASDSPSAGGMGGKLTFTPGDIALDNATNRALVVDPIRKAVIAIDLDSGAASILSDSSKPDAANAFEDPRGIAVDESGSRALVVDAGRKAIIAVDLTTGARSVFSSNSAPSGQVQLSHPLGIVVDNTRALVTDSGLQALIAVDLSSGERLLLESH